MKKNINDYLHLYLGCRMLFGKGTYIDLTPERLSAILTSEDKNRAEKYKPILRPLSDITEEEREELNDIELGESSWPTVARALAPCFAWMLSKGFDLFGLIESGLAIDKSNPNNVK